MHHKRYGDEEVSNARVTADEHGGKVNGKGRGSVKNGARLAGLRQGRQETGAADWGRADPRWLAAVVTAASLRGMIVSFKLSRDGGAHGLELFEDGDKVSLWFNGDADLDVELEQVHAFLESLP